MVAIPNNGNDTLKSTTIEGQIWELTHLHTKWQKDTAKNPNNLTYVSWSITTSGANLSAQYEFKTTQGFSDTGGITHTVQEYLVNTGFINTQTNLKSTTPTAYLVELLFKLQQKESLPSSNTQNLNNVSAGFPVDTDVFSGSVTLSLSDSDDGEGNPTFPVKPYLT
ncbi:hypothetical protein H6F77_11650 [Microcoleus sp. FACHB-831]|uniref:hypothetical protein n=1 Tax=Microcoleus sp. FACHB-831 TaxID=2692827 RepID=UPI0016855F87|nr:hypothetical protein [Microcoleus sp. FACHB-831]MBD1921746.1 hypothetical protein [Microcoleus sp. FACHB-831]